MPSDEELIGEILDGSQAAMEVLVKRYYKVIFAYVYRNMGDYHTAYDITQDVFIKMMKSLDGYREKGKFKNWLFRIASNTCYDYYRSRGFRNKKGEMELDADVVDQRGSVWDLLSRNMERKRVKDAVLDLPDYQKDVVILRFYHDMKIKDIAKVTDSKEATVKSRLRQGLEKLRKVLGGGEEHEKRNRLSNPGEHGREGI